MKKKVSFADLYLNEKSKPTAAQKFIDKIVEITHKSPATVRQWISGALVPDFANRKAIADAFGVDVNSLFPEKVEA